MGGPSDPVPAGFLELVDLGADGHWTARRTEQPNSRRECIDLPARAGAPVTAVAGLATGQVYRGTIDPDDHEWFMHEQILTLTPADAALARLALAVLADGERPAAPSMPVLVARSSPETFVVLAERRADGTVGFATIYAVAGNKLVHIDVLPGGAAGGVSLPGGVDWLLATTERAISRAA